MSKIKEIDRYIGKRINFLRIQKGVPLKDIADVFNISVQQAQKYMKGTNRISAGNLALLAKALGIEVNTFYEGYDLETLGVERKDNKEFIEISNKFVKIKSAEYRQAVNIIIEGLSKVKDNLIRS